MSGWFPVVLIILTVAFAYFNAWPDVLVHDDKFFVGPARQTEWASFPQFFVTDLWAGSGVDSGLYRPLLLVLLALESRLHGDWLAGYHLDNILLHLLVTLVVYGFLRQIPRTAGAQGSSPDLFPLLAALVFAVHPVHTEVVNSIFNRSEMMVTLAGVGGLWWLLHFIETRAALAWLGLALCYLFALFSRESAVMIPALAAALLLMLSPGTWRTRLRKCLPALWLLLPLALYLVMRAQALAPPDMEEGVRVSGAAGAAAKTMAMIGEAEFPGIRMLRTAFGAWGQSLWLLVWPDPLLLYHGGISRSWQWIAFAVQIAILGAALLLFRAKRYALLVGLAFFYIAILPASRLLGVGGGGPHLAERYLYFPVVGLTIPLAAGFQYLGQRYRPWLAIALACMALSALTPLTLARNSDWSNEMRLFESEYRHGNQGPDALRLITAAYIRAGFPERVAEICDRRSFEQWGRRKYANHCGIAYAQLGRNEDAERAYLAAASGRGANASMCANLARFYLRLGRRQEAIVQFERAITLERTPEMKSYRLGLMLATLHPRNRQKLLEARAHFAEAVRLQPQLTVAQTWLVRIDRALGPAQR